MSCSNESLVKQEIRKFLKFAEVKPKPSNDNNHYQTAFVGQNKFKNEFDSFLNGLFTHLTQIRTRSLFIIVATVQPQHTPSVFGVSQTSHIILARRTKDWISASRGNTLYTRPFSKMSGPGSPALSTVEHSHVLCWWKKTILVCFIQRISAFPFSNKTLSHIYILFQDMV